MAVSINTREILKGVVLPGFPDIPDYDMSKVGMNAKGKDALGRYFFMDVELYSNVLGRGFRLPNEPLVRTSKQKSLVTTVVAGNEKNAGGVVIEQVNAGNYRLDLVGIILNEEKTTPQYPQDQVRELVEFCESGEALEVQCDLLNNVFGINKLVIEEYSFDSMQGKPYSQLYSLSCMSYTDFLAKRRLRELS